MALLQIKNTLEVSEDGKSLIYTDITGEDNLSGSTKYSRGITNTNYTKTNNYITEYQITKPDGTIISIIDNKAIDFAVDVRLESSNTNVVPLDTLVKTFSLSDLNINESLLPVGVYKIKIINWFYILADKGPFIKINNTKLITPLNPNKLQNNKYNEALIKLLWGSPDIPYQKYEDCLKQDTTASIIEWDGYSTTIVLNENITIADKTVFLVFLGYETENAVLVDKPFLDCYQPKIARISVQPKSCCPTCKSADIDNLYDMWMGYLGVLAQFASGKYNDANSNMVTLGKICSSNCNCGC